MKTSRSGFLKTFLTPRISGMNIAPVTSSKVPRVDEPGLLELFARLVHDELGLDLEDVEPLEIDARFKALLDAWTDEALAGQPSRPRR